MEPERLTVVIGGIVEPSEDWQCFDLTSSFFDRQGAGIQGFGAFWFV